MRTTVTLDDRLLERLKKRAAESGTSVSRVIERAVRLLLQSQAPQQPEHFDLVTFGEGGRFTPLNIDKTAALMEADDIDRFGRLPLRLCNCRMSTSSSTRIGSTRQSTIDTPLGLEGWSRPPNPSRSRRLCSPASCESLPIQRSFGQQ